MQAVLASIRRVAAADVPVLLVGEKGTGKRLAARTIHRLSARSKGPFNIVNCGSIPNDLIEVEFFGHEKGAFTGAYGQRKGAIELSHGAASFLMT
jgi:DNA-binding NtrC family response regulator